MVNSPEEKERRIRRKKKRQRERFRSIVKQSIAAQAGGGHGVPVGGSGQMDFSAPNNSGLEALIGEF